MNQTIKFEDVYIYKSFLRLLRFQMKCSVSILLRFNLYLKNSLLRISVWLIDKTYFLVKKKLKTQSSVKSACEIFLLKFLIMSVCELK